VETYLWIILNFKKYIKDGEKMSNYKNYEIEHFGIKLKNEMLKISRENYAIIDKKPSTKKEYRINMYKKYPYLYADIYEDETCSLYTDSWCEKHKKECLINYDKNMKFFSALSIEEFNNEIKKIITHYDKIIEIKDLNYCDKMIGIYIMVLDEYKQVYIGISRKTKNKTIKDRIVEHWKGRKKFDKLIYGTVENSNLHIDSFGAYDTTRIFVYPTMELNKIEYELINLVDDKFLLNRTEGGIDGADPVAQVKIMAGKTKKNN